MSQSHKSFSVALTAFSKHQIQQAGHRYTPGIDPDGAEYQESNHSSSRSRVSPAEQSLARDFSRHSTSFFEAWNRAKYCSQRAGVLQQQADDARAFLSPMLDRLRARDTGAGEEWLDFLSNIESDLSEDMDHWRAEEAKLLPINSKILATRLIVTLSVAT